MKTTKRLIKCTFSVLLMILSYSEVSSQWVKFNGSLPAGAFLAGKDGDGTDLYIARAYHVNGTHIGKYRKGANNAFIPWGGVEHSKTDFEIFTGTGSWSSTSGTLPPNAISGGNQEGKTFYIARANMAGNWHPGKATFDGNTLKAWIPYGGKEHVVTSFDVLMNDSISGGINTTSTKVLTHGLYKIKNVNSGKYIGVPGGNRNESRVIQWSDVGQLDIVWNYTINNYGNGFCNVQTDNTLSSTNNNVAHLGWPRNEEESVYDVLTVGNAFVILHKKSKKIVGVENSSSNDGAILKLFDYVASPSKNCLWNFEPFIFDNIEVVVKTGGDDLRGGNEAFLQIDGTKFSLNNKAGWGNNTSKTIRITSCKITANSSLSLIHDGSPRSGNPFDSYDNWNQDYILIRAYSKSGQAKVLYESSEKTRFTGDKRSRGLGIPFLCITVIPG